MQKSTSMGYRFAHRSRGCLLYRSPATSKLAANGAELSGWPVRLYLLQKPAGSPRAGESDDVAAALSRAVAAGARPETDIRTAAWGKLVVLADPFGHGLCLIEFLGRSYDEIASS
jgi:hypothetical protein